MCTKSYNHFKIQMMIRSLSVFVYQFYGICKCARTCIYCQSGVAPQMCTQSIFWDCQVQSPNATLLPVNTHFHWPRVKISLSGKWKCQGTKTLSQSSGDMSRIIQDHYWQDFTYHFRGNELQETLVLFGNYSWK